MSTFEVPLLRIDDVYNHPNADRLSIVRIRGYEAVAGKLEDGSHRFEKGEIIIYVPEGAIVPDRHLIERGYWFEDQGKGMLAGPLGNRVQAITLRGVLSQGLVWKTKGVTVYDPELAIIGYGNIDEGILSSSTAKRRIGQDVADFFEIEKYIPEVPDDMKGKMVALFESRLHYDIENIKDFPDFFQDDEDVVVTEKLHGVFCRLAYLPNMTPEPGVLFGDGRCAISTKGMGADGLTFIDVPENDGTLYVGQTKHLVEPFQAAADELYPDAVVHLMGEVFGPGVQDLSYGQERKAFRAFDVAVYDSRGKWFLDDAAKEEFFLRVGIERVPVLYRGPYSRAIVDELATGMTTLTAQVSLKGSKAPIREGVVITATGSQDKREADLGRSTRPILKNVSPTYLTRKGGTEYQ